jgi:hypothetical protein
MDHLNIIFNYINRDIELPCDIDEVTDNIEDEDLFENYLKNKENLSNSNIMGNNNSITDLLINFEFTPRLSYKDLNILEYWESQKKTKFELYKIAQIIYATPAAQVSVERLFSTVAFIIDPRRSNLNQNIINDIIITKMNDDVN